MNTGKKNQTCQKFWGTKHTFSKWKVVEEGNLMNHRHNPPLRQGFWIKQERWCGICNFKEVDYKELF